jgi:hypothetical protein
MALNQLHGIASRAVHSTALTPQANRRSEQPGVRRTPNCTRNALHLLAALAMLGSAVARAEHRYKPAGGSLTGQSEVKRHPASVVGDDSVAHYEASVNPATWTSQLGAPVTGVTFEEAPPDACGVQDAHAFALLTDNFVIRDSDNPHLTGTLDTGLWMDIHAAGPLLVVGSLALGGEPASTCPGSAKRTRKPMVAGSCPNRFGLSLAPAFPGPDQNQGNGVLNFNAVMTVNLCDPRCPEPGEPFRLKLLTNVAAYGVSTGSGNMPTIVDASFGNTFSISFSRDDPARRCSVTSEGGYVSPVAVPPASWRPVSALAVMVRQRRLSRRG